MKNKLKSIILCLLMLLAPHISVLITQCIYSNYVAPAYSIIMILNFISIELSILYVHKEFSEIQN